MQLSFSSYICSLILITEAAKDEYLFTLAKSLVSLTPEETTRVKHCGQLPERLHDEIVVAVNQSRKAVILRSKMEEVPEENTEIVFISQTPEIKANENVVQVRQCMMEDRRDATSLE